MRGHNESAGLGSIIKKAVDLFTSTKKQVMRKNGLKSRKLSSSSGKSFCPIGKSRPHVILQYHDKGHPAVPNLPVHIRSRCITRTRHSPDTHRTSHLFTQSPLLTQCPNTGNPPRNTGASTAKPTSVTPSSNDKITNLQASIKAPLSASFGTCIGAMSAKIVKSREPRMKLRGLMVLLLWEDQPQVQGQEVEVEAEARPGDVRPPPPTRHRATRG